MFFGPIRKPKLLPWHLIGWDLFSSSLQPFNKIQWNLTGSKAETFLTFSLHTPYQILGLWYLQQVCGTQLQQVCRKYVFRMQITFLALCLLQTCGTLLWHSLKKAPAHYSAYYILMSITRYVIFSLFSKLRILCIDWYIIFFL